MSTPEKKYPEQPMDPQIENLLETLRPTPPRDPDAAERGRQRFLAEMEEAGMGAEPLAWYKSIPGRIMGRKNHYKDKEGMNMQPRRFAFTSLAIVILAAALLFGGASITAAAAQGALPGDALYRVKTTIEDTRLSLARDAGDRAQMRMGFAERRLEEITALVEAGRYNEVGLTAQQFEAEINGAITELGTISAGDPTRAATIASQISSALSQYAQTLTSMAAAAPDSLKPELNRALVTTQRAGNLSQTEDAGEITGVVEAMGADVWTVDGQEIAVSAMTEIKGSIQVGDVVKVHLVKDEAGVLTAREIEPAGQEDDGGANGNANGNDNANGNVNENANENENGNDDVNVNENGNDDDGNNNGNENEIEEDNANENANGNDDDGNLNDNANINENANDNDDGNANDNTNINENANTNGDDGGHDGGNANANVNDNTNGDDGNGNDGGGNSEPGGGGNDSSGGGNDNGGSGGGGNDNGGD